MIQLFLCSSYFQALSCAAFVRAGDAGDADRCVLVVTSNVLTPEIASSFATAPGASGFLEAFDDVVNLNEAIYPTHPRHFVVDPLQAGLLERYLRGRWNLGDAPVELILESLPNAPGGSLARVFTSAGISMHSDGLMSYGPLRNKVPDQMGQRIASIYYTDLIPGLVPRRLGGFDPRHVASGREPLRELFDACGERASAETGVTIPRWPDGTALLLGQYLTDLGTITRDEEVTLHRSMIDAAVAAGCDRIAFKPHPAASRSAVAPLEQHATAKGAAFEVVRAPMSAEAIMGHAQPALVVSCFSTALATARYVYGIDAVAVGTELVRERLTPYENSNRVPVVTCDALFRRGLPAPADEGPATPPQERLNDLVGAVTYVMQPRQEAHLKPAAQAYLAQAVGHEELRYFAPARLTDLKLPGAVRTPTHAPASFARRAVRYARRRLSGRR